ncbi:MAG: iron ABC transporter permease [Terrimicrobiaceae bacterium]|nr:iron ABC transporter permease [Terrimicrobiaceae bacterium]
MALAAIAAPPAGPPDLRVQLRRARVRRRWQFAGLVALLAGAGLAAMMIGPMRIPPRDLGAWAMGRLGFPAEPIGAAERLVIERIRLPRVVLAACIGAALATAGAAFQGLFRNPLADPGLIGVSAAGALGAVGIIVLGHRLTPALPGWAAPFLLPVAAFAGSLAAVLAIYRVSLHEGRPVMATMLLAGVAINALASAATGFLTFLATDQQVRDLTFWLLGSLGAASWPKVALVAPGVLLGLALLPFAARALNALLLGEEEAGHLGFDVWRTKWIVMALAAVMVGLSVAFAGVIGFVGLIVPHAIRLAAGPDHRFLLPASALLGAALLVAADLFARCIVAPAELPIGILTALLGAPFFLWLLLRVKVAWQP